MVCCTPMTSVVPHEKACGQYIHIHWLHVTIYYEHKKSHIKWFVVMDIDDNVGATWHTKLSTSIESKIHPILTPTCFIYVGYTCNLSFLNGRRNQCWFHIKVVDINLHYEWHKQCQGLSYSISLSFTLNFTSYSILLYFFAFTLYFILHSLHTRSIGFPTMPLKFWT